MKFADELVAGLEFDGGFDISIDRHSIDKGEDWKARLGALIEEADSVVFVLSPASAQSEICRWEVDEADRLKKRILPVLHRSLRDISPPPQLAAINYIDFTTSPTLIEGIRDLTKVLRTDFDWLRESRRLLVRALEWDRASRRANRLLSGDDISQAKEWLEHRPKTEEVTELHRDYIKASAEADVARRDEERNRLEELARAAKRVMRRTVAGLVVATILAAIAGVLGWQAYERGLAAKEQARLAREAEKKAAKERDAAKEARRIAERRRLEVQTALVQSSLMIDAIRNDLIDTSRSVRLTIDGKFVNEETGLIYELSAQGQMQLMTVAVALASDQLKNFTFAIEANYIAKSPSEDSVRMSLLKAYAVREALVTQGVARKRIWPIGLGAGILRNRPPDAIVISFVRGR